MKREFKNFALYNFVQPKKTTTLVFYNFHLNAYLFNFFQYPNALLKLGIHISLSIFINIIF